MLQIPTQCTERLLKLEIAIARHSEEIARLDKEHNDFRKTLWRALWAALSAAVLALANVYAQLPAPF